MSVTVCVQCSAPTPAGPVNVSRARKVVCTLKRSGRSQPCGFFVSQPSPGDFVNRLVEDPAVGVLCATRRRSVGVDRLLRASRLVRSRVVGRKFVGKSRCFAYWFWIPGAGPR